MLFLSSSSSSLCLDVVVHNAVASILLDAWDVEGYNDFTNFCVYSKWNYFNTIKALFPPF